MGKKRKTEKQLKKQLRKKSKARVKVLREGNCKIKCCEKYQKSERKRCKRCPCYDLMKEVA